MHIPAMAFLERATRTDTRHVVPMVVRLVALAPLMLVLWVVFGTRSMQSAPGRTLFSAVVWIDFVVITIAGIIWVSSAVTEEKEEGTLPLLKMTGMQPVSILLGKGFSRVLVLIMILAAQMPIALLSVSLGGLTQRQFWAAYATLGGHLAVVSGLALFASVLGRTARSAAALTILFAILWGALGSALFSSSPGMFSAGVRLVQILDLQFAGRVFGAQSLISLGAFAALFGLSVLLFEPVTERTGQGGERRGLLRPSESGEETPGEVAQPRTRRWRILSPGLAWTGGALCWKDFHFTAGGWLSLGVKTLVYVFGPVAIATALSGGGPAGSLARWDTLWQTVLWFVMVGTVAEILWYSDRLFGSEHRAKTLSGLCVLPVSTRRVVIEKVGGVALHMTPNVVLLMLAVFYVLASSGGRIDSGAAAMVIGVPLYLIGLAMVIALASLALSRVMAGVLAAGYLTVGGCAATYVLGTLAALSNVVVQVVVALVVLGAMVFGFVSAMEAQVNSAAAAE